MKREEKISIIRWVVEEVKNNPISVEDAESMLDEYESNLGEKGLKVGDKVTIKTRYGGFNEIEIRKIDQYQVQSTKLNWYNRSQIL